MNTQTLQQLYAYNKWANEQVWQCVAELPEEKYFAEHDYSVGSLFNQVFHVMQTEWWSLQMFKNAVPAYDDPAYVKPEAYTDRAVLWKTWQSIMQELAGQANKTSDADLHQLVKMPVPKEYTPRERPLWEHHMWLLNHSTNHRAQILALLYQNGGRTVEQGYYYFVLAD